MKDEDRESQNFLIGKEHERRISDYLYSIGFTVIDISLERYPRPDGDYYSPFDILAMSEYYSFVADVKYRSSRGWIPIDVERVDFYLSYIPSVKVDDKLIIICTPGLVDSFISVDRVQRCYIMYSSYAVGREETEKIAALRKKLEEHY